MEKIFTLQEIAEKLKVSERTIFRYLRTGKITGSKIGQWRFTEKDIKDFLNKNRNKKIKKQSYA